jgi:hypothetical protein
MVGGLKEAVPKISSVAVFWDSSTGPTQIRAIEAAAQILNIKLVILEMPGRADVESHSSPSPDRVQALY